MSGSHIGAALIVNTLARQGERALVDARGMLDAQGVRVTAAWPSTDPGRLGAIVKRAQSLCHSPIIVGGGDGSISTAAGVLARSDSVLGVLPLGTANDFARTLGIPPDLESACAVIARGEVVSVDLGQYGERYYLNLASIGLAGDVATILPHWLKKVAGKLAYPLATVIAVTRFEPFEVTLTFPGEGRQPMTIKHVLQVGVGNGRYFGGGMAVAPEATLDDGTLDVHAIKLQNWRQMFAVAKGLKTGAHVYQPGVFATRVTCVDLAVSRKIPVDVDGELSDDTSGRFCVARAALKVLAPRPA